MWLETQHRCAPPINEVDATVARTHSDALYWLCEICGEQFRITVGEYGAKWYGPEGEDWGWVVSYSRVSR